MLLYLTNKNFNLNKNKLQIEIKDSIVIVCFFSSNCKICENIKKNIHKITEENPKFTFGLVNIDKNMQLVDIFKKVDIHINVVPIYAIFKLGVLSRILTFNILDPSSLKKELYEEIECSAIKPKNYPRKKYKRFSEM